jgi:hypothetical protein
MSLWDELITIVDVPMGVLMSLPPIYTIHLHYYALSYCSIFVYIINVMYSDACIYFRLFQEHLCATCLYWINTLFFATPEFGLFMMLPVNGSQVNLKVAHHHWSGSVVVHQIWQVWYLPAQHLYIGSCLYWSMFRCSQFTLNIYQNTFTPYVFHKSESYYITIFSTHKISVLFTHIPLCKGVNSSKKMSKLESKSCINLKRP